MFELDSDTETQEYQLNNLHNQDWSRMFQSGDLIFCIELLLLVVVLLWLPIL